MSWKVLLGYVHLLGQDSFSWAFDIPSGQLFHRGHVVGSVGSVTNSDIKRRIGMEIDFEAGRLIFRISIGHLFRTCTYVSKGDTFIFCEVYLNYVLDCYYYYCCFFIFITIITSSSIVYLLLKIFHTFEVS